MSNYYHVVLHDNINAANAWSRDEILQCWTKLFTGSMLVQHYLAHDKLSEVELNQVDELAKEYQVRLQYISWFMRCLNEYLAREANKEYGCRGRIWERLFKSQYLLDEAVFLTCMAYVDLNSIR